VIKRSLACAAVAFCALAGQAQANSLAVNVEFQAFDPASLDALPGDEVIWSNIGGRTHTVTADNGTFDSGDLLDGHNFSFRFASTGRYTYHCTIHRGMVGEVDVRRVTLDPLPPGAVVSKSSVTVSGRTADPAAPVQIQASQDGVFKTIATATPSSDGNWSTVIRSASTIRVRAASGADLSETRRLLVINRTVRVHANRRSVAVDVEPSDPHALVALQYRLHDRFGWWRIATRRLDYLSEASFPLRRHRGVRARVVLLGPDHWTPVAISRVF
jgi:plastocyanin